MTPEAPICLNCKYYNEDVFSVMSCKAYPNGIPEKYKTGNEKHTDSNGKDNGIFFKPKLWVISFSSF